VEKEIEMYLHKCIKQKGLTTLKFTSPNMAGVPDRVILLPDQKVVWVEVKRPGGKVRLLQQKRHLQFEALGHKVLVISTKQEVDDFVNKI